MCRWLAAAGKGIRGGRIMEVGTGHVPVVPIGFFLAGAAQTITVVVAYRLVRATRLLPPDLTASVGR